MTLTELKAGILSHMMTVFPSDKFKYYSLAVVEGYERPCFFTQLKPVDTDPLNFNTRNNLLTLYLNYFQKEVDEVDILETIDKLRDLFGLAIKIGDRAVKVTGFEWDYVGTDRNVPEIQVNLQWSDKIEHLETEEIIESVKTNTIMEE